MESKYMKELNENVEKGNIRLPYEERIKEIKDVDSKISMNEKIIHYRYNIYTSNNL